MKFNLDDYETVKSRKKRFYEKFPDGRITVAANKITMEEAIIMAFLWKNVEEQEKKLPLSSGIAHEFRDTEAHVSGSGKEYYSVNYACWVENCEESAIGRALDNAGFSGNDKCSLEEMKKAESHSINSEYVIPFGKFKDKTFSEITKEDLLGYCIYIKQSAQKEGKEIKGKVKHFIEMANKYLGESNDTV